MISGERVEYALKLEIIKMISTSFLNSFIILAPI